MFFFFKQKTAYEMLRSLVGSEMCIRDSMRMVREATSRYGIYLLNSLNPFRLEGQKSIVLESVSYTHLTLPTIYSV